MDKIEQVKSLIKQRLKELVVEVPHIRVRYKYSDGEHLVEVHPLCTWMEEDVAVFDCTLSRDICEIDIFQSVIIFPQGDPDFKIGKFEYEFIGDAYRS